MERMGFVGEVIGHTPSKMSYRPRGFEIQDFLDDNTELNVESFVILDDIDNMEHLSHRLVLTDPHIGLQDEHVDKALALLLQ